MEANLDRLSQLVESIPNPIQYSLMAIGGAYLARRFLSITGSFYRQFLSPEKDLALRYGKGSWALITGAGSGIGREWARQLAQRGFNIILVEKADYITEAAAEIEQSFKVKTVSIKVDLSVIANLDGIVQQVQAYDISVIVNNAAMGCPFDVFHKQDRGILLNMVNVNAIAATYLTHALLPKLVSREKRSAIIFLSSVLGIYASPKCSIYSATKFYLRGLAMALKEEYKDKIDVLTQMPWLVSTNFTLNIKHRESVLPVDTVKGAIRDLGKYNETFGATKHHFVNWFWRNYYGEEGVTSDLFTHMEKYYE